MNRRGLLGAAVVAAAAATAGILLWSKRSETMTNGGSEEHRTATPTLSVAAQSDDAVWNAVAVEGDRMFLAGPRWSGMNAPPLVVVEDGGTPRAYPDAAWNGWKPGSDAAPAFVNINALRLDGHGGLWVVDTGAPDFGGDPLPGGAKLVRIDLATNEVDRVIRFDGKMAEAKSYVDDVRFNGERAYVTDASNPGIIVIDMRSERMRRVLDGHPSTSAGAGAPDIVLGGETVIADGKPLRVQSDPLEVSPNGEWLFYGTLEGPWSRVPTRLLDDFDASDADVAAAVEHWADIPPTGGTTIDAQGTLYFSDLATNSYCKRTSDGTISTVIRDDRLHWVDAQFLDVDGTIYLPAAQLDRAPPFHDGVSRIERPVTLFALTGAAPARSQVYRGTSTAPG